MQVGRTEQRRMVPIDGWPVDLTLYNWNVNNLQCTCILGAHSLSNSQYVSGLADTGSVSGATFQRMKLLPFICYDFYLHCTGHLSLLGLQTKTRR